jgi:alcohol dehydrogenase/L-iditol 2-dehydrogenase
MKAVVKFGQKPNMVELREVQKPIVIPGKVLVEVKAAGVCGWDIEMWRHRTAYPVTVPVIQGHEFCGVISEVGEGVRDWKVGDRVTCETSAVVCGHCPTCAAGEYQLCPERKGFGYGVDGAFTDYVLVREEIVHPIPPALSFEDAAITEIFCVAHHGLTDRISVQPGDTVVVIGPGPVGLASLQIAGARGAARRILLGAKGDEKRMNLASESRWADDVISIDSKDPIESILALTKGHGADVVVDAAGNSQALHTALEVVKRLGQVVKIGWGPQPYDRSLDVLLRKSILLTGTFGHNRRNWRAVLGMLDAGQIDSRSMVSAVFSISEWQTAFELAESKQAVKVLLKPEG